MAANVVVQYWQERLRAEEKAHDGFRKAAERAERDYFDEREDGLKQKFPIFWPNVQILHAAVFSNTPRPDVRKRNEAGNVPERIDYTPIAQAVERALNLTLDSETDDFNGNMDSVVDDLLIPGCGVGRIRYDADVSRDEEGLPVQLDRQAVRLEHVPWRDFHWEPGKSWKDCDWVAFDEYLTRTELKKQFGKTPDDAGLDQNSQTKDRRDEIHEKYATKWRVTEIWHRPSRRVIVIGWGFDAPLEQRDDQLKLKQFFPCPKPMFANVRSKRFVPKPDYDYYATTCQYINTLTERIENLTQQIRDINVVDASLNADGAFSTIANAQDGDYVSIAGLAERLHMVGGAARFDAVVANLPIADKANVVQLLIQLRDQAKQATFEINGISDIVRGVSDPRETKGAQQIKGQYAGMRLARRQKQVARFLRDAFRLMTEIIGEHYTRESIHLASGIWLDDAQMEVLRSDLGRTLAIDVETESTVAADDETDKRQSQELLTAVVPFLREVVPQVQSGALPADLAKEFALIAIRGHKGARTLESAINALPNNMQQLQQLTQQLQQTQQALQQCQQQLQKAQQQLQQVDMREQAREDYKAQTDAQGKQMEGIKDMSTTRLNDARAMQAVRQAQQPQVVQMPQRGPPR